MSRIMKPADCCDNCKNGTPEYYDYLVKCELDGDEHTPGACCEDFKMKDEPGVH